MRRRGGRWNSPRPDYRSQGESWRCRVDDDAHGSQGRTSASKCIFAAQRLGRHAEHAKHGQLPLGSDRNRVPSLAFAPGASRYLPVARTSVSASRGPGDWMCLGWCTCLRPAGRPKGTPVTGWVGGTIRVRRDAVSWKISSRLLPV